MSSPLSSTVDDAPVFSHHRLPTLVEIATSKCMKNVSNIDDIGLTPFHLLKPILKKMNAKQLELVESTSPQIEAHSDILWISLIERDFPDRPLLQNKFDRKKLPTLSKSSQSTSPMPNKHLYFKYLQDREDFRKDSAQRLRNITKQLKLKKSENSIISVPELLKDPTVRRSRYHNGNSSYLQGNGRYNFSYSNGPKNSILNKAKRDVQTRSINFKNSSNFKLSSYDPYDAFKLRDAQPAPKISVRPRHSFSKSSPTIPRVNSAYNQRPTNFSTRSSSSMMQTNISQTHPSPSPGSISPPLLQSQSPLPLSTTTTQVQPSLRPRSTSPSQLPKQPSPPPKSPNQVDTESSNVHTKVPPLKRRKIQHSSIFLNANRNRRPKLMNRSPVKIKSDSKKCHDNDEPKSNINDTNKKLKPIKSSIFS